MGYRENVQAHCDRLFISNPLRERDLRISKIDFFGQGVSTRIEATPMNRAGRLFFQLFVDRPAEQTRSSHVVGKDFEELRENAVTFFAENWLDAEEAGRPMLIAFKQADSVLIHWQ